MQVILGISHKNALKSFLIHNKIKNIKRYIDALVDENILLFASINNKTISTLIITHLKDNVLFIEKIIFNNEFIEVGNTLKFINKYVKEEQLATSIIYENFPYDVNTSSILLSCGYKLESFDYEYSKTSSTSLIKRNLELNLKSDDVLRYMNKKYKEVLSNYPVKDYDTINLDNINTLVAIENENIVGALRFCLVNESIRIDHLYANQVDIYIDLVNMIKNITNKKIEINVLPSRRDLIEALNFMKFEITNASFKINLDY